MIILFIIICITFIIIIIILLLIIIVTIVVYVSSWIAARGGEGSIPKPDTSDRNRQKKESELPSSFSRPGLQGQFTGFFLRDLI